MPTDKEFEDFFRQQLGSMEEAPPPMAWNKIKADLRPWYRRYQWLVAAAFCGLLSVGVISVQKLSEPGKPTSNAATLAQQEPSQTSGKTNAVAIEGRKAGTPENMGASPEIISVNPAENADVKMDAEPAGSIAKQTENLASVSENPKGNSAFSGQKPTVSGNGNTGTKTLVIAGLTARPKHIPTGKPQASTVGDPEKTNPASEPAYSARYAVPNVVGNKMPARQNVAQNGVPATETHVTGIPETLARTGNPAISANNGRVEAAKGMARTENETPSGAEIAKGIGSNGNPEIALLPFRGLSPDSNRFKPALPAVLAVNSEIVKEAVPADSSRKNTMPPQPVWAFSAFISPRVTFSRYAANRTDKLYVQKADDSREGTSDVMSVEGGLTLQRTITPRLTLDAGVVVTHLKDQVQYILFAGDIERVQIKTQPGGSADVQVNYHYVIDQLNTAYTYAGLRMGASYTFKQTAENRFYVTGGGGLQMLVKSQLEHYRNGQLMATNRISDNSNPLNNLNSQVYAGFGFAHKVTPRLAVTAEPAASYFLGSVFREKEALQLKPYTFGVNVGFRLDL
jgi:cytoskeletal protein RodZ